VVVIGFRRVLVALVALMTLALLAPWGTPRAVADGDRLGCGTFCQNAGGYGAPGNSDKPSVAIASGTITPDADGYAPATVTCDLNMQCNGALLLCLVNPGPALSSMGMAGYCGRSDLLVNASATRTIGVPLPAALLTYLRSNGPATADLNAVIAQPPDGFAKLNSANVTLAPPG
jgi:hypothetical protein